jgi:hypothetical protein
MWMIVDVFLVSSSMVLFTHILVPSLIMKDVNKIKQKLVDNIREFNRNVNRRRQQGDSTEEAKPFNAAEFLFVSTRLAKQWSELRESQIITQFRTPWPKQSYQRESNVSKGYSKKYSALVRSASVIAVFFLTQLLQIPAGFQDMVVRMASTTVIGYTILAHIDLYEIFPVLAFVPVICVAVAAHYYIKRSSAAAEQELCRVHVEQAAEEPVKENEAGEPASVAVPVSRSAHLNRMQSMRQGMNVANRLKLDLHQRGEVIPEDPEGFDNQPDKVHVFSEYPAGIAPGAVVAGEEHKSSDESHALIVRDSDSSPADNASFSVAKTPHPADRALINVPEDAEEQDEDSSIYGSDALSDVSDSSLSDADIRAPTHKATQPSALPSAELPHQQAPRMDAVSPTSVPHALSAPSEKDSDDSINVSSASDGDAVVRLPRAVQPDEITEADKDRFEDGIASTRKSESSSESESNSEFDSLSSESA